jgi:hypothetical protein
LQDSSGYTNRQIFVTTGLPTDNGSYVTIPVAYVSASGSGSPTFPNLQVVSFAVSSAASGYSGYSGSGVSGFSGFSGYSGSGGGGGITYTLQNSNYTASANEGVLTDTSAGSFTVTLPASPATGVQVVVADSAGTWATNNLIVGRNGSTIQGSATDLICDVSSVSVQLVYNGTTWDVFCLGAINSVSGFVTPNGVQTLTNKTLVNPTITDYTESVVAVGTVTTTSTLSLTNGTVQTATLTASTACTFTMPTAVAGKSFILLLKQAATTGAGTATFTGVKWGTAGAPTVTAAAGSMDIFSFVSDGTNWYGTPSQGYTP